MHRQSSGMWTQDRTNVHETAMWYVGDSMFRYMSSHVESTLVNETSTKKVGVIFKSGAKISAIPDLITSQIESRPEVLILHAGTNDLKDGMSPSVCLNKIEGVLNFLQHQYPNVTIFMSSVIPRGYNKHIVHTASHNEAIRKNTFYQASV